MKVLITGVCGFVGSSIARELRAAHPDWELVGIDNFSRAGSWLNRESLESQGVRLFHGDIRSQTDVDLLPACDWVIDAAANASVLAGVDGKTSARQLVENNLFGTINLLEYCKRNKAGFILLSTSRVYSIPGLAKIEMEVVENPKFPGGRFQPKPDQVFPSGISVDGISEAYSTQPPVSLYGSTKVTSEHLALEYGETFDFPVWINRCGVMAGAGQFGHPAQGIFAYWIHSFREGRLLKYIGFGGKGYQVRDCMHPRDLIPLLEQQMNSESTVDNSRIINIAGGIQNSMSLAQLTAWCQQRFPGSTMKVVGDGTARPFDIPWMVLDPASAKDQWNWTPTTPIHSICEEIANFAEAKPDWLAVSHS